MKVWVIHKNTILIGVLSFLIAIMLLPLSFGEAHPASGSLDSNVPIYSVETPEKRVAVTFNAAWDAHDVESILNTLRAHACKATFFLVGTWAEKYPAEAKQIAEEGHEIGSHSYNHADYTKLKPEEIRADIRKANAAIKAATGIDCKLIRAPFGAYSKDAVRVAREEGMEMIQWSADSLDYEGLSGEEMEARIMPHLENGAIILFHTGTDKTQEVLPYLLHRISEKGYGFATVGEIMYKENYTINHAGRQIPQ